MKYFARCGDKEYACELEARDGDVFVTIAGERYRVDLGHVRGAGFYTLLVNGRSFEFDLHRNEEGIALSGGAGHFQVVVEDERTHAARGKTGRGRGASGPSILKAVMPGIVREVLVAEGDAVSKGQALLILEAMKMQNEVRADRDGTVARLFAAAGDTVDKGQKLVEIGA